MVCIIDSSSRLADKDIIKNQNEELQRSQVHDCISPFDIFFILQFYVFWINLYFRFHLKHQYLYKVTTNFLISPRKSKSQRILN